MLTEVQRNALDETRSIVLRLLRGRSARVYLFGSYAAGAHNRFSDIDVAIDAGEPLPPALKAELDEAVEDSTIPYFVDIVDLAEVSPELRWRVEREGVPWSG